VETAADRRNRLCTDRTRSILAAFNEPALGPKDFTTLLDHPPHNSLVQTENEAFKRLYRGYNFSSAEEWVIFSLFFESTVAHYYLGKIIIALYWRDRYLSRSDHDV
jgi:hypothetical protein